jgi:hypothetical protein
MRDAQIGLLVATPLVLAFAARLYYLGALGLRWPRLRSRCFCSFHDREPRA